MSTEHSLKVNELTAGYDGKRIIHGVNLEVPVGSMSVLIGANACGKSTLLKTIARLISPMEGEILLDGKAINHYAPKKLAQILGILPQSPVVPEGISVSDLAARGRFPYHNFLRGYSKQDYQAVEDALKWMDVATIAGENVSQLSGGQRQRVWIAMALAQQTDILLLDEPTTFLDIAHQIEILELLANLNRQRGTTILMVLHDINMAARYADHVFAMKDGRLIAQGAPEQVISRELIQEVFDLDCVVVSDPVSGSPMVVPKGRVAVQL